MRKNAIFWLWAVLFFSVLVIAAQPVGLNAQFTFGLVGIGLMLIVRIFKLRGTWSHVFMMIAAAIVFRYMYWRLTSTLPSMDDPLNFFFGLLLFAAEAYSVGMLVMSFFIISDPVERKEAPLLGRFEQYPSVDIFVPSYNESLDLVGMTLAAAKNLNYPAEKLNIYLLDDGGTDQKCNQSNVVAAKEAQQRRVEMKAFCDKLGVHYLTRARNEHAKAGNLNVGLQRSSGDLVVVFDADHAPTRDFLQNTVGYFQRDPKLFLVQTPHFFINPDPVEKNLETFHRMPSENEMFYSIIQKGLDKWNGTFFCGSAAVLRRSALQTTNGFSGDSITEDCETALELHARGWHSLYVNKPMISGLQPETFSGFIGQRSRWCQGMLQILLLKRPMFRKGLKMSQRVAYTSSPLFWLFPISRLTFMLAPALYVFFDMQIYNASLQEFIAYTMFFLISNVMVQNQIFGTVRWPWVSELYEYVQSLYLIKAIASVVLKPHSPTFNVTAKGETLEKDFLSPLAMPYFVMFFFLAITTGWALQRIFFEGVGNELLLIVTLWSTFNLVLASVALGVVAERKEQRAYSRLPTQRQAQCVLGDAQHPVMIENCSAGGMSLRSLNGFIPFVGDEPIKVKLVIATQNPQQKGYPLDLTLVRANTDEKGVFYSGSFNALSVVDYRAIAAIMYPNTAALETIRQRRHNRRAVSSGTIEFLTWSIIHTFRGFSYGFKSVKDVWANRKQSAQNKQLGQGASQQEPLQQAPLQQVQGVPALAPDYIEEPYSQQRPQGPLPPDIDFLRQ